jgi:hypothetical protein
MYDQYQAIQMTHLDHRAKHILQSAQARRLRARFCSVTLSGHFFSYWLGFILGTVTPSFD